MLRVLPKLAPYIKKDIKTIDYTMLKDDLVSLAKGYDLVCLDNADLYLTRDLVDKLDRLECKFLVAMKRTAFLSVDDYATGNIVYEGETLRYVENNWKDIMYGVNCFGSL